MLKSVVFIDGSNFYHKLKELSLQTGTKRTLLEFDYTGFIAWLTTGTELIDIRYYVGAVKRSGGNQKSEELYANQQKLFAKLQLHKIKLIAGHLIRHPDGTFHEKGVDVRLAVEMIRMARANVYDRAYLLSSDTDLVAAVEEVRSLRKAVHYVGIAKGQSFGLTKASDDVRLLRHEDVDPFLPPVLLP
ncbi:MAG TPA: NYN domain-containing protein [Candidatus Paceibacterota bacterium]|nr:NYN domain-containing protein [Candidatus Paceibacterota bacterium]